MFTDFKKSISDRLDFLIKNSTALYQVDVDKDEFWELYLNSFPPGTNEIFRQRREYDCSCCGNFIKNYGTIVGIIDNKKVTLWSEPGENLDEKYQIVSEALDDKLKSLPVSNVFYSTFPKLGTDSNIEQIEGGENIRWSHFYYELPSNLVLANGDSVETAQSKTRQTKEVIERSFKELTKESIEDVLDMIDTNLLYRGKEFKESILKFKTMHRVYNAMSNEDQKDNFCWVASVKWGRLLAIRNTAIGTLLTNLSKGLDTETAVKKYESVMAPANYKRPTAIFTKSMKEAARNKVHELGLENSLGRRYAQLVDVSVRDVIWASGESRKVMKDPFDELDESVNHNPAKFKNVEEITVEKFVSDILPGTTNLEVLVENSHINNFVSLIAPEKLDSPSLFKWDNGFSWAYNGDFTDSIKESVKTRGGKTDGDLRFSLSWAEGDRADNSDLDAHCVLPKGEKLYFGNPRDHKSGGELDVDIRQPHDYRHKDIVENITFPSRTRMHDGEYKFRVHGFAIRGSQRGFTAEIEIGGEIHSFEYGNPVPNKKFIDVAIVTLRDGVFTVKPLLPSTTRSRKVWGIDTMQFLPVSSFMYSPNHWGDNNVGNRHYFFMLQDAKNDGQPRGFFNEFLKSELTPHRRVFEALGEKMRVPESDEQLSGVGFADTKNDAITVRVDGKPIKINFNNNINIESHGKHVSESTEEQISL